MDDAMRVLILNGPGVAAQASAEGLTLSSIESACAALCAARGADMIFRQSVDADEALDWISQRVGEFDALIVNPAGLDGALHRLAQLNKPVVEAHIPNIFSDGASAIEPLGETGAKIGFISGLGLRSYLLAIESIARNPNTLGGASGGERKKVRVLNGPNLNLLGTREPAIYGSATLAQIAERCAETGAALGLEVEFLQSNYEGQLVDWIQGAIGACDALVINAAAFTHYSIAIHDALRAYDGYKIELHISNPHQREAFRRVSYVSSAVDAVVAGLGPDGYELVTHTLADVLRR